jgi:signal transduction histidine kinase
LSADSNNSDIQKFEKEHQISTIFQPHAARDKIVIQVTDTGIGIQKRDMIKLFKLFGTLKNTSQMNT